MNDTHKNGDVRQADPGEMPEWDDLMYRVRQQRRLLRSQPARVMRAPSDRSEAVELRDPLEIMYNAAPGEFPDVEM